MVATLGAGPVPEEPSFPFIAFPRGKVKHPFRKDNTSHKVSVQDMFMYPQFLTLSLAKYVVQVSLGKCGSIMPNTGHLVLLFGIWHFLVMIVLQYVQ